MPSFQLVFVGNSGRIGDDKPVGMDWLQHVQKDKSSLFARTRESFLLGSPCVHFLGNTPRLPQLLAVGLGYSWVLTFGG